MGSFGYAQDDSLTSSCHSERSEESKKRPPLGGHFSLFLFLYYLSLFLLSLFPFFLLSGELGFAFGYGKGFNHFLDVAHNE
jgi:hypothetical protein